MKLNLPVTLDGHLADTQDRVFAGIKDLLWKIGRPIVVSDGLDKSDGSDKSGSSLARDIENMRRNLWVRAARYLAPSNLVVRQYCLLDMLQGNAYRATMIAKQLRLLAYVPPTRDAVMTPRLLWSEGYSYWEYTRPILAEYAKRFGWVNDMARFIAAVDKGFQATAYLRNGAMYPAPFGDLRNVPLRDELQNDKTLMGVGAIAPVRKLVDRYAIDSIPLGLNDHVEQKMGFRRIVNGVPREQDDTMYQFYEGYANSSHFDAIKNVRAWKSIIKILKVV